MSEYLSVLLLAAMPISELRGAIPAALTLFGFSPLKSYILAVAGNLVPAVILLWFLPRSFDYFTARFGFAQKVFGWYAARLQVRNTQSFKKWGPLALLFFVAVPLPLTGAWSGAILAFLFNIPFWQALRMIAGGVVIAGGIVLGGSLGFLHFL